MQKNMLFKQIFLFCNAWIFFPVPEGKRVCEGQTARCFLLSSLLSYYRSKKTGWCDVAIHALGNSRLRFVSTRFGHAGKPNLLGASSGFVISPCKNKTTRFCPLCIRLPGWSNGLGWRWVMTKKIFQVTRLKEYFWVRGLSVGEWVLRSENCWKLGLTPCLGAEFDVAARLFMNKW